MSRLLGALVIVAVRVIMSSGWLSTSPAVRAELFWRACEAGRGMSHTWAASR